MEGIPDCWDEHLVGRAQLGVGGGAYRVCHRRLTPSSLSSREAGARLKPHHLPLPLQHLPAPFNCSTSSADTTLPLPGGSASPRLTVKPHEAEPTLMSPGSKTEIRPSSSIIMLAPPPQTWLQSSLPISL